MRTVIVSYADFSFVEGALNTSFSPDRLIAIYAQQHNRGSIQAVSIAPVQQS